MTLHRPLTGNYGHRRITTSLCLCKNLCFIKCINQTNINHDCSDRLSKLQSDLTSSCRCELLDTHRCVLVLVGTGQCVCTMDATTGWTWTLDWRPMNDCNQQWHYVRQSSFSRAVWNVYSSSMHESSCMPTLSTTHTHGTWTLSQKSSRSQPRNGQYLSTNINNFTYLGYLYLKTLSNWRQKVKGQGHTVVICAAGWSMQVDMTA